MIFTNKLERHSPDKGIPGLPVHLLCQQLLLRMGISYCNALCEAENNTSAVGLSALHVMLVRKNLFY